MKFSEQSFSRPSERNHALIQAAYPKAEAEQVKYRVDPRDFIDLYGKENVQRDIDYVNRRKQDFKRDDTDVIIEDRKLATIFETILFKHVEQSDWFGSETSTILASDYDDIFYGVDAVLQIRNPHADHSYLALGIDVTYSIEPAKKLDEIAGDIEKGMLARVKYFNSDNDDYRGELRNVPKIVLGLDAPIVEALALLDLEGNNAIVGRHPAQFELIEEAILQCQGFAHFARKVGHELIAKKYEKRLVFFQKVLASKKTSSAQDFGDRGKVYSRVKDFMHSL